MSYMRSLYLTAVTAFFLALTGLSSAPVLAEPSVLITGSNRGIGLELARVYAERGWTVIATCRSPSKADDLNAIAAEYDNVSVEELDLTDDGEITALAVKYQDQPLDILLNNAGIPGAGADQVFGNFNYDTYELVMAVNVHGPMKMAEAFISNVEASDQKKIINISSTQGSVAKTAGNRGMTYFYKSSKSALNMVSKILSIQLKSKGITVGLVSPGWVDTHFGGLPSMRGMITPRESAEAVIGVIDGLGLEQSGILMSHRNEVEPW
jgi:NAD(P)-dependent dehydrogenase (short-subunit alcohol dehydrogenase family)